MCRREGQAHSRCPADASLTQPMMGSYCCWSGVRGGCSAGVLPGYFLYSLSHAVTAAVQMCGAAAEQVSNYKELFSSVMTAEAFTNCDLYVLDASRFHELAEEYPRVTAKLHAWALR